MLVGLSDANKGYLVAAVITIAPDNVLGYIRYCSDF